jgi:hypothetical protein
LTTASNLLTRGLQLLGSVDLSSSESLAELDRHFDQARWVPGDGEPGIEERYVNLRTTCPPSDPILAPSPPNLPLTPPPPPPGT